MKWYLKAISQYADFSGRARRSEYWFFVLFNMIFALIAAFIDAIIGTSLGAGTGIIYLIYLLFSFIPGLSVAVRRLHDAGKSGWMYLIILIPIIGPIWLLVLLFSDSQVGENKWGANPKEVI